MRISVDLHIHSDLSPCADQLMSPGNIVGMAVVNGLDAIAITDHNSSYNIPAAMKIAAEYGVVLVPGMELETCEEIHVVCLFADFEQLEKFQKTVNKSYNPVRNFTDIFGEQHIYNEKDEVVGEWEHMLLSPTGISVDNVFGLADSLGGIAFPAHVDRDSYSVLSTFGMLPYGYPHNFVEISCQCDTERLKERYPGLKNYRLLRSSDAHYCEEIQENGAILQVEEISTVGIIRALKDGKLM